MKAFVEHLSGVVRAGPDSDCYGKPFDYAIAFSSTDGKTAVIKALVTDGNMTVAACAGGVRSAQEQWAYGHLGAVQVIDNPDLWAVGMFAFAAGIFFGMF